MTDQAIKTQRKLKCISLHKGSQSEEATCYNSNHMTFWKRKTSQTVKRSVFANWQGRGWNDDWAEPTGFIGQWKYSVWCYTDGFMLLRICPNPLLNTHHQGWTLMKTMDFGWLWFWCYDFDRFVGCNKHTTLVGDIDYGEAMHVCGRGHMEKCLPLILLWTWNCSKKIVFK